jgi:hypothetical protein
MELIVSSGDMISTQSQGGEVNTSSSGRGSSTTTTSATLIRLRATRRRNEMSEQSPGR